MKDSQAIALHDATERLTYARLIADPKGVADAEKQLELVASAPGEGHMDDAKRGLIDADPVSAAALGWMTFPALLKIVRHEPARYMDADEAAAVTENSQNLRHVVRARSEGKSFASVVREVEARQGDFALAARGDVLEARRLLRSMSSQGMLNSKKAEKKPLSSSRLNGER